MNISRLIDIVAARFSFLLLLSRSTILFRVMLLLLLLRFQSISPQTSANWYHHHRCRHLFVRALHQTAAVNQVARLERKKIELDILMIIIYTQHWLAAVATYIFSSSIIGNGNGQLCGAAAATAFFHT